MSAPRVDAGNIVGNVYDKYNTQNPIARALMRGFTDAVTDLYLETGARSVLEVGCGNGGNLLEFLRMGCTGENITGLELLPERAERARRVLPAAARSLRIEREGMRGDGEA